MPAETEVETEEAPNKPELETVTPDDVTPTPVISVVSGIEARPDTAWATLAYPSHLATCVRQVSLSAACSCGVS